MRATTTYHSLFEPVEKHSTEELDALGLDFRKREA